jgi:hypothetical protein
LNLVLRSAVFFAAVLLVPATALATPTKDECLEAHGRGQDQREAGHLALARDSFAVCSQPSCPALVQSDCAEYAAELERLSPTIGFAARDQAGRDLPDTQVYVDGVLVAPELDEGKTYDVDPGKHAVRFLRGERSVLLNIVVTQGERGRNILATFTEATAPFSVTPREHAEAPFRPDRPAARRSAFPLVVALGGGVAVVAGGVLTGMGLAKVPENCSISSHECTAAPGDPVFDDAHSGAILVNAGLTTAIAGAVIGVTGLVWYFAQSPSLPRGAEKRPGSAVTFTGTGFRF